MLAGFAAQGEHAVEDVVEGGRACGCLPRPHDHAAPYAVEVLLEAPVPVGAGRLGPEADCGVYVAVGEQARGVLVGGELRDLQTHGVALLGEALACLVKQSAHVFVEVGHRDGEHALAQAAFGVAEVAHEGGLEPGDLLGAREGPPAGVGERHAVRPAFE